MEDFSFEPVTLQARWSDVDANGHVRHSAYADYGGHARVRLFAQAGFDMGRFAALQMGPILFREQLLYHREIGLLEEVSIDCALVGLSARGERWALRHRLTRGDGVQAATIDVEGAWLDLQTRKLCAPPRSLASAMRALPRAEDYADIPVKTPPAVQK